MDGEEMLEEKASPVSGIRSTVETNIGRGSDLNNRNYDFSVFMNHENNIHLSGNDPSTNDGIQNEEIPCDISDIPEPEVVSHETPSQNFISATSLANNVQQNKEDANFQTFSFNKPIDPGVENLSIQSQSNCNANSVATEIDSHCDKSSSPLSSTLSSDPLPDCRNKRTYVCGYCNMKTLNPREYLYHLRDVHHESLKIYECTLCTYATKTSQKLSRHKFMVHDPERKKKKKIEKQFKPSTKFKTLGIIRNSRESKSPRRFEEFEFIDEDVEFDDDESDTKGNNLMYKCDQCKFYAYSIKSLTNHENKYHLKRKFYKCTRCSYATQVKARYTKHLKYHDLPIIKCDFCDFRSPYRWNLDRHMKNHTDNFGEHCCHLCNFNAPLRQSLTFHIMNHHLTAEQIREREAKRTIGINDFDDDIPEDELELLRLERDEDLQALQLPQLSGSILSPDRNFTVSNIDISDEREINSPLNGIDDSEDLKLNPKIKLTLKKMKTKDNLFQSGNERHNFDDDFVHPDDVVHRNGNLYIKTEKCSLCPFKAPFQAEVQRHKKKVHGIHSIRQDDFKKIKSNNIGNSESSINNLDMNALNSSSSSNSTEMLSEENTDDISTNDQDIAKVMDDDDDDCGELHNTLISDSPNGKKKTSFFEKLQEKISESNVQNLVCQFCGHESKCLSESVRHQKLHLSVKNANTLPSLSTRCQFCRHRCKTTDDLVSHLQSCSEARKNQFSNSSSDNVDECSNITSAKILNNISNVGDSMLDLHKHPMENKVFVWNNIADGNGDSGECLEIGNQQLAISPAVSEGEESVVETTDDVLTNESNINTTLFKKKVFRCPQCPFWAQTASRFHGHMLVHFNTKPFRCSECNYKSNWRWDITKHIKIRINKDQTHFKAEICLDDETGDTNYKKYNKYLKEITMEEILNTPGKETKDFRSKSKRCSFQTDTIELDSEKSSPSPSPLTIPLISNSTTKGASVADKIPALPKLKRAPNDLFDSFSGLKSTEHTSVGCSEAMVEVTNGNNLSDGSGDIGSMKISVKPPPLVALGNLQQQQQQLPINELLSDVETTTSGEQRNGANSTSDGNYEIITAQGSMNTNLEMVQLLAAASTNLAKLKAQQKETGEGNDPELDAAVANQLTLLIWLNCLVREAGKKEDENVQPNELQINSANTPSEESSASNVMQLVLDHEGKPEWKCANCEFRDNEKDTVLQHVRLAHGEKGTVSLMHAVHRCSVCGFAAGTKRHVQLHIEQTHGGQGGIISRSEGQRAEPVENGDESSQAKSFSCRMCPFTSKKRGVLKAHLSHHTPRSDFVFKCMFCPFYVATKNELFNHLVVHGMNIRSSDGENSNNNNDDSNQSSFTSVPSEDAASGRHFVCDLCPFETRSRAKLMHHRQFHRPRGLPFSCPYCTYNVTRRHLLAQHLRIHGVSPTESLESAENGVGSSPIKLPNKSFSRSKSPSPSLTITPISSGSKAINNKDKPESPIDPSCLPVLSDELTKNLKEIPLVWVSRNRRYFKMFKCRHCPHVNHRKGNIQEHEKMHRADGITVVGGHTCQFCSYTCINAGVLTSHLKVHAGSMGISHAIVDQALQNEEQIHMLARSAIKRALSEKIMKKGDEKFIYYCQHCPARFFYEKEVQIHSKFHVSKNNLSHHCSNCDFGAREESQILAHAKVHTPEYQERTRVLMTMHPSAPFFGPTSGISVPKDIDITAIEMSKASESSNSPSEAPKHDIIRPWLNSVQSKPKEGNCSQPASTSRFKCDQCPSTFSKLITLQYHQSLHSADNPYRCHHCTYAAKTEDGLQQHISLHEQEDSENRSNSVVSSSPSLNPSPVDPSFSTKALEETIESLTNKKSKGFAESIQDTLMMQPPIKMKFIGRKDSPNSLTNKQQFKYYIEEQVPLSGIELLKRKTQIEKEMPKDTEEEKKIDTSKTKVRNLKEDKSGNPSLHYPLYIDKNSGKTREKRYKCSICPSAFEKSDQYNVHINLHGSNYKYRCKICDYSVKFYANFMMHSKRHIYHEKMVAQKKGLPLPAENLAKYEPSIGTNPTVEQSRMRDILLIEDKDKDKENQFDLDAFPDMTTAEKQQLLLQEKKGSALTKGKEEEDKKIFYCPYCPYANLRRDAVDSHSCRHQVCSGRGHYSCLFCDYSAAQPNFIREHTKIHFRPFKYVQPEGYMRHDKLEIWSIVPEQTSDDTPKKNLTFSHEEGNFTPDETVEMEPSLYDSYRIEGSDDKGISVDFRTAEAVDAPPEFVISIRPGKSKSSTSSGSSSKHKSSKSYKKARKKTKLESPLTILEDTNDGNSNSSAKVESPMASSDTSRTSRLSRRNSQEEPIDEVVDGNPKHFPMEVDS